MRLLIYFIGFLFLLSCVSPKKNTPKTNKTEKSSSIKEPKNELVAVLKNPKNIDQVKALITNSGLSIKDIPATNTASNIIVIKIPDENYKLWLERLQNSQEFKTIQINKVNLVNELIKKEKNTLISIQKTKCFGDCPSYELTIDKEGNVLYNGKAFVLKKGKESFKLSNKALVTLKEKLKDSGFSAFKETYDNPRIMDLQSTYITYNGKQVKIRLWNDDVPESLMELHEFVEGILLEKKFFE